jgi:uncharacterized protein YodC (DUF2158 family)
MKGMRKKQFNKGEIVQLKSGGPLMTVLRCSKEGVICCWFDNDGKGRQKMLPPEAIVEPSPETLTDEQLRTEVKEILENYKHAEKTSKELRPATKQT